MRVGYGKSLVVGLFLLSQISLASSSLQTVFGPQTLSSPLIGSNSKTYNLPALQSATTGTLYLQNGSGVDLTPKTCSGNIVLVALCKIENAVVKALLPLARPSVVEVSLNGVKILAKPQWSPAVGEYTLAVNLKQQNQLKMIVSGFIGTSVTVEVKALLQSQNASPNAVMALNTSSGFAPLTVTANAFGSTDSDGQIVSYEWNFGDGSAATGNIVSHVYTDGGSYTLSLKVTDDKGGIGTASQVITVTPNLPPVAVAQVSKNQGIAPLMVEFNGSASSDSDGVISSYKWDFGDGSNAVGARVTHEYAVGSYNATLTVTDNHGQTASKSLNISAVNPVLPPDPAEVAPVLSSTQNSMPADISKFLYTGDNPIQTGVIEGAIDGRLVAVIRGRLLQEDGQPLSGVKVSVLGDASLGQTVSREDGRFDIVVNGGGSLVISFERSGYYSVQRRVSSSHLGFATVDDIYMLRPDSKVTLVKMSNTAPQIAKGSESSDDSGARTATVIVPSLTSASLRMADGSLISVPQLNIRAKEYTVGPNGRRRMPAELPSTSAYTYAVQLTADEVDANGAKGIQFSKPVSFYVENFLGFDPGDAMPVGIYNSEKGRWEPTKNGRVIKVLSVQNGKAVLDVTGAGAASAADLTKLEIDDEELGVIGSSYQAGTSLWRVRLDHFSIVDINAFQEDIANTNVPTEPPTSPVDVPQPCNCATGSVIQLESRTLGESVGIQGTSFSLNYSTERAPGRSAARTLDIPITPNSLNDFPNLKGVDLKVVVAGKEYKESFSTALGQVKRFTWDGVDVYGRKLYSGQLAEVSIGYRVSANYLKASSTSSDDSTFAFLGPGLSVTSIPSREETVFTRTYKTYLGVNESVVNQALAGWSFNVHHVYDPVTQTIYTGDGFKRSVKDIGNIITTVVGSGTAGFSGDGGPAKQASIAFPGEVTIGSDNSIYFRDSGNNRLRKVDPSGNIKTIAGNGIYGYSGDGGPAIEAKISNYGGMAVDTEGDKTIYFSDYGNTRIRKIAADGTISTVAGNGTPGFSGDGGPATSAQVNGPVEVVAKDGYVYFNDTFNHRVRVIRPNGTIQTVAGNGVNGYSGDGGPAVNASINQPLGLSIGPNGDLYITDSNNGRVRRIDRSGIIRTVAGGGSETGDGVPATQASLYFPTRVVFSKDSTMYISSPTSPVVRRVSPEGIISTFAGTSEPGAGMAEGELVGRTRLIEPYVMAIGPDDSIYVVEQQQHKIKKISRAFPGVGNTDIVIPSVDGSELYVFDQLGKHLLTRHALTGAIKYSFAYTSDNRLASITDGDGNTTAVVRSGDGTPTQIIAPFGQVTQLSVGSDLYLSAITNANSESYRMTYGQGGMLASFAKPKGNTSVFTYNAEGQLEKDQDAAGGFTSLTETLFGRGYSIPFVTAEGRSSRVEVRINAEGKQVSNQVNPDGIVSSNTNDYKGTSTESTVTRGVAMVSKADPRIGAGSQYTAAKSIRLSSGHLQTTSTARSVVVQANNPFSFVQTDTVSVNGRISKAIFDSNSLAWSMTSPEQRELVMKVDLQNRPVLVRVPNQADQVLTYNSRGLLSNITQGVRATDYVYDTKGRLSSVKNALGQIRSYVYDDSDRVVQTILPGNRVIVTDYDKNGNVIGLTPAGKPKHLIGFDLVDLMVSYLPPVLGGPEVTQYQYNLDKEIKSISRPDGQSANYTYYSGSNRLQKIATNSGDYTFSYYPDNGLVSQINSPDSVTTDYIYEGGLVSGVVNSGEVVGSMYFTHDNDFRVSSSTVSGFGSTTVDYQYDNDGLLTKAGPISFGYHPASGALVNSQVGNIFSSYGYNQFGEIDSSSTSHSSGAQLYSVVISRDDLGRIKTKSEKIDGVIAVYEYGYDTSGRLTDVSKDGVLKHYTYDANGNRISESQGGVTVSGQYNDQDQLLSYGSTNYTYRVGGNLESKSKNGSITQYSMDVFGNLKKVIKPDGRVVTYMVDAQNRRVGKSVNGVKQKYWIYSSQLRIEAEVNAAAGYTTRFIYGKGHAPESMILNGVTYRFVTDYLGSVRLVVNSDTGAIIQKIDYDEFGKVTSDTFPGLQPFGFAGGLYDADTGLVRFGVRDYDPELGRWTTKDPIGFAGGDTNLYGYVWNDPINLIDPEGKNAQFGEVAASFLLSYLLASNLDALQRNIEKKLREWDEAYKMRQRELEMNKAVENMLNERSSVCKTCPCPGTAK